MVVIKCPIIGCSYETTDCSEAIACVLLTAHTPQHTAKPPATGPKLDRPRIDTGITPEEWNIFKLRWDVFVNGSGFDPAASSSQLFQCASEELGNSLLKADSSITSKPTADLMKAMKTLAVVAVATGVIRAELVQMKQDRGETFRTFAARVRGKAETCSYTTKCSCNSTVNFTDIIVRDVLIAGISDLDIRRDILGTDAILQRPVNDVISLVESKEMARNALPTSLSTVSSLKREEQHFPSTQHATTNRQQTAQCPKCSDTYKLYSEGRFGWNTRPHRICLKCYKERRRPSTNQNSRNGSVSNNAARNQQSTISFEALEMVQHPPSQVNLFHHIFTAGQWKTARFQDHPRVNLTVSTNEADYLAFGRKNTPIKPFIVSAMVDSGAQSCLWSLKDFLSAGFAESDLLQVSVDLVAANRSPINVAGAIILRLQGRAKDSDKESSCASMVYVSKDVNGFYLSCEAMVDLCIVPSNFPSVGAAPHVRVQPSTDCSLLRDRTLNSGCSHASLTTDAPCSCPPRSVVPDRPKALPFTCIPENNVKMKDWLLKEFGSSTFNTCPHRPLPCMSGPPVEMHIKDNVTPKAVHKAAPVPVHWQEQVLADLQRDEKLGVIEKVPYGEPVTWCHRMVVTRKHDGSPRRTVDLSPLNKHCERETFCSESPFHLARKVPQATWKTVTDAWNGYHSVPLRVSDRHLTTFITPFGRWRYTRAPQGFLSSGDGYNRRFDAILTDFERKERCVDDTIHYDTDLREHWWRTIDFLILTGRSGIVLNPDKFCFAQRTVDFAGFCISDSSIEPLPKYLDAIRDFPRPTSITDIRSWFGLVNQVANYAQLRDIMAPFKPFLSPKHKFEWTPELDNAFQLSKSAIIDAIRLGVEIFDPEKQTCLRPDWSRQGIGYFLLQKHCTCTNGLPDCCPDGWKITLAGSRFLTPTEQRYAPIEGEALAVAWSLEQTRYFTQGCRKLLIVTDHKPLVKILGDRTLDEISNTRIFRIKQRTLPWSFDIVHLPGKTNFAADATSRNPSPSITATVYSGLDQAEAALVSSLHTETRDSIALSWETIASETAADPTMSKLLEVVSSGFPDESRTEDSRIASFWIYRDALYVSDGVILYNDRVVIPPALRNNVLQILHAAHQGVSAMESRARAIVFWPGLTEDIRATRDSCSACNRSAPSQAAMPSRPTPVPSTPFESIYADFFDYAGNHYLVAGDRLSGWVEIFKAPSGTAQSGANGLILVLREMFATFGVPEDISSDGGPEFTAALTLKFFENWGIRHRISSVAYAQSNGRAEVAVKKAKRILMDNINPNGSLNNDNFLRAMLQARNTPEPDCNVSPAEVVFGRPIRDAFSFVNRCVKFRNPSVRPTWRQAWSLKERAMKCRMIRNCERLDEHTRPLTPLHIGDQVLIQNQRGPHPTKWDKSGMIVDAKPYDQYLVKVDGSGRLTTRNRRFLRTFLPASLTISNNPQQRSLAPHFRQPCDTVPLTCPISPPSQATPVNIPSGLTAEPAEPQIETPPHVEPTDAEEVDTTPRTTTPQPATPATPPPPMASAETPARPRRNRKPRKLYVPETGQWD